MKDVITLREKETYGLISSIRRKKEKKKGWDILSPFLRKYVSADEETRIY